MRYFCFCQGDVLLNNEHHIPFDVSALNLKPWNHITTLKIVGEECNVIRLDAPVSQEGYEMVPLRKSYEMLSDHEYQLAGKCAELIYWDQRSKFCGCCGAPMKWDTEISKRCTGCRKELWPQLDTAIIVRITRTTACGEEIFLVRAHNFRGKYYGLVAGFVETGENLEECVRREVREETGFEISDLRYFGSQPWPYPCGLMIGFTARYSGGNLHLQRSEIADGGWFSRESLPEYPGPVSIAGLLIRDWLQ